MAEKIKLNLPEKVGANAIRAVNAESQEIAKEEGLEYLLPANWGNPTIPYNEKTLYEMIVSILTAAPGYGTHHGTDEQRQRMSEVVNFFSGIDDRAVFKADKTALTGGATAATAALTLALVKEGGYILIPDPGYPGYRNQAKLCGRKPLSFTYKEDGSLNAEDLRKQLKEKGLDKPNQDGSYNTFLLIRTVPNNPTGHADSAKQAEQEAKVFNEFKKEFPGLILYEDSIYKETCVGGFNSIIPYLSPEMLGHTITASSGAKSLATMAKERIGSISWVSEEFSTLILDAVSALEAGANQHAAEAYTKVLHDEMLVEKQANVEGKRHPNKNAAYYNNRRNIVCSGLGEINKALETAGEN